MGPRGRGNLMTPAPVFVLRRVVTPHSARSHPTGEDTPCLPGQCAGCRGRNRLVEDYGGTPRRYSKLSRAPEPAGPLQRETALCAGRRAPGGVQRGGTEGSVGGLPHK